MATGDEDDWFSMLFGHQEPRAYKDAQSIFQVDEANRTITGPNGAPYDIGTFTTPSVAELREQAASVAQNIPGKVSLRHIATTDVLKLHGKEENNGALFQAASQFNCLEFPSYSCVPEDGVTGYIFDRTQGPACAIAAGPGTVYRNYFAKVNGQVGQTKHNQINNLRGLEELVNNDEHGFWQVRNGYTFSSRQGMAGFREVLESRDLDELRQTIRIGLHTDVQVPFKTRNYSGMVLLPGGKKQIVTQAYCSAVSCSYSGLSNRDWRPLACLALEAAYEATLLAGVVNAANGRSNKVFLTFLGGGVFGNDEEWIAGAIGRAVAKVAEMKVDLEVLVTHFRAVKPSIKREIALVYEELAPPECEDDEEEIYRVPVVDRSDTVDSVVTLYPEFSLRSEPSTMAAVAEEFEVDSDSVDGDDVMEAAASRGHMMRSDTVATLLDDDEEEEAQSVSKQSTEFYAQNTL